MAARFEAPKGTRDFLPGLMTVRDRVIRAIEEIYRLHGFQKWDGPAFEYLETLTAKSSPESVKEIYDFEDKAGRKLGLRFEQTTTLARMMAANPHMKKPVRTFSTGKVWRYENTQKGRYREFLQMDADVFGVSSVMEEAELFLMARAVLERLGFAEYRVLLNNRKVLNGLTEACGIPENRRQDAFRAMDKLAKIGPDGVKKEFLQRGLTEKQFVEVFTILDQQTGRGNEDFLDSLNGLFPEGGEGRQGVRELKEILSACGRAGFNNIVFDLSLIRGFDYYTGPVFEIRVTREEDMGSIAGGGRYDRLVEAFGGEATPAVGISFGIERVIDIIEQDPSLRKAFDAPPAKALVIFFGEPLAGHALELAGSLRSGGAAVDIDLTMRNFKKQMQYANDQGYPFVIIVGEDEVKSGEYSVKDLRTGEQKKAAKHELAALLKAAP